MPPICPLVSSFIARQGVIVGAGLLFLLYTFLRSRWGYEKRDLRTFCADCSKQAGQQMIGGLLLVALGVLLSSHGYDALAWYGAEYPFEILLTTFFTGRLRVWTERGFRQLNEHTHWTWLTPFLKFGQYGPEEGLFFWSWYAAQLLQAVLLIGVVARILALSFVVLSLAILPPWCSPVHLVADAWFHSGMSCDVRTAFILYMIPLIFDAIQFIIIDGLQKFKDQPEALRPLRKRIFDSTNAANSPTTSVDSEPI